MYALNPTFGSYYHKIHIVFFISDYTLVCLGFNSPLGILTLMGIFTTFLHPNKGLDFMVK